MDDQRIGRTVKTRHLDALKDLQKNENDRLQKIKNEEFCAGFGLELEF